LDRIYNSFFPQLEQTITYNAATLYRKRKKKNKKLQFYYQLLALTCNNIVLYKSCVYCKHKTSLMRCNDYFREQYYAFRNRSFSI